MILLQQNTQELQDKYMKILAMVQIQTKVQKKWPGEQEHVKKSGRSKQQTGVGDKTRVRKCIMYQKVQKRI